MESCSRKRKAAKKNGSDYISQLPDDILIHILSNLLSTKEAVQTCLAAKRWSYKLLAQVPSLDFDFADFNSDDNFTDCVTSVLKYRGPTRLDTFRLARERWDGSEFKFYPPLLEWISQVLQFSPRSICIRVCAGFEDFTLPESLFTCETLEELEITIEAPCVIVDFNTKAVKLPRLKKLHLSYVYIDSTDMNNLLTACPLLENLYFECCILYFSQVSSNTLKRLVVVDCDLQQQEIQFPFLELHNSS